MSTPEEESEKFDKNGYKLTDNLSMKMEKGSSSIYERFHPISDEIDICIYEGGIPLHEKDHNISIHATVCLDKNTGKVIYKIHKCQFEQFHEIIGMQHQHDQGYCTVWNGEKWERVELIPETKETE